MTQLNADARNVRARLLLLRDRKAVPVILATPPVPVYPVHNAANEDVQPRPAAEIFVEAAQEAARTARVRKILLAAHSSSNVPVVAPPASIELAQAEIQVVVQLAANMQHTPIHTERWRCRTYH